MQGENKKQKNMIFEEISNNALIYFKPDTVINLLSVVQPATLLKLTLLHGCFSRFLNCTNVTKSSNAPHLYLPFDNSSCCGNTSAILSAFLTVFLTVFERNRNFEELFMENLGG